MNSISKIQKVRKILLRDWDPFCVGDNPNLSDEYDSFIDGLIALLAKRPSPEKINQYLEGLEKELHAPLSAEQRVKAVKALHNIDWTS